MSLEQRNSFIETKDNSSSTSYNSCSKSYSSKSNINNSPGLLARNSIKNDPASVRSAPIVSRSASASHSLCLSINAVQCREEELTLFNDSGENYALPFPKRETSSLSQCSPFLEGNSLAKEYTSTRQKNHPCRASMKGLDLGYSLSTSSSNASFFLDSCVPLNRLKNIRSDITKHRSNKKTLIPESPPTSRPQSLYLPFVGCVEAKPFPPGKEARDILMALSFTPIKEDLPSCPKRICSSDINCYTLQPCHIYSKGGSLSSLYSNESKQMLRSSPRSPFYPQSCPLTISNAPFNSLGFKQSQLNFTKNAQHAVCLKDTKQRGQPLVNRFSITQSKSFHCHDTNCYNQQARKSPLITDRTSGVLSQSTADITTYPLVSSIPSPVPQLPNYVNAERNHTHQNALNADEDKDEYIEKSCVVKGAHFDNILYYPTHPLNHPENTILSVTHPPVLHPPLSSSCTQEKLLLSPIGHRTLHGFKPSRSRSASNCSMLSQNSHSSSSGEQLSYETSKSTSLYSSFSSSSIASICAHQYRDQNISPDYSQSCSSNFSKSSNSNTLSMDGAIPKKLNAHGDYVKLESIRETSPFFTNNDIYTKSSPCTSSNTCQ